MGEPANNVSRYESIRTMWSLRGYQTCSRPLKHLITILHFSDSCRPPSSLNLVAGASSSQGFSRSTPSLLRLFCFVPVGCQWLFLFNALPSDPTLSRAHKFQACHKPSKIMHTIDVLATERTRNDHPQNHEMGFGEMSTTCREPIKRGTSASTPGTQLTFVNPLTSYLAAG